MKRKIIWYFFSFGVLPTILVFHNACSQGFVTRDDLFVQIDDALQSSTPPDANEEEVSEAVRGEKLYSNSCATCHLPHSNSTIKGTTPQKIADALATQPLMAPLRNQFTQDDINAISASLNNSTQVPGKGTFVFKCSAPTSRGLGEDRIRRLTRMETVNTLKARLGNTVFADSQIQTRIKDLEKDEMNDSPTSIVPVHTVYYAKILYDVASRGADLVMSNTAEKNRIFGTCASNATVTESCVKSYIQNFGLKVYRRPLSTTEVNRIYALYQKYPAGNTGLRYTLAFFLQSPGLAYHIEDGTETTSGDRIRLTDYEVASRISYLTAGTMPDDTLFAAAQSGELKTVAGVKKHVQRLLATSSGREKVQDFFRYYAKLSHVPLPANPVLASLGFPADGLGDEMRQEAFDFINHVFWQNQGTFNDLMTARIAFPRTPRMASIFDTTVMSNNQPVTTRYEHSGLFHRPALLAGAAPRTSPILRGAHMRKDFLCDNLGAPPANANEIAQSVEIDFETMTNRQIATAQTSGANCVGCHTQINPIGFAFEGHDSLGRARKSENLFDSTGKVSKTFPIDTVVMNPMLDNNGGGPTSLRDSIDLVTALGQSYKAKACFTKKAFEYYRVRDIDFNIDGCALSEAEKTAENGSLINVIVSNIANEDIFWRKAPGL